MLQHFHILTLTHRQSELKDIGALVSAIDADGNTRDSLQEIKNRTGVDELFYVGTCNRVTLFFTTRKPVDQDFKVAMLGSAANTERLLAGMVHYQGRAAVNHLFAVAASIDSLVIGERQILGQLREAYEKCRQWNLTGDDMRVVFDQMVVAAKDVYANTRIGEKSVSVVSLAVRKMLSRTPKKDARILLLGAGQTNNLVAKFLRKYDYHDVTVFNRSLERAQQLADTFQQGRSFALSSLASYQDGFDVLFVCTASNDPIVTDANIANLLAGEDARDKIVIDLAVPNNVADSVVENHGFEYVSVEHLRQLAQVNMTFRSQEIEKAQQRLVVHENAVEQLYRQRLLERALKHIPSQIKEVKQKAVQEVFAKQLATVDPNARELMEEMLTYMEKKCISIPMKAAREALFEEV
ncbi:MAG: glutamyl-tRNA reductase [Bacteroidota bacterium]